ncbi:magnesium transporter MRS2-1-like protein [Tanacetum coccineum]
MQKSNINSCLQLILTQWVEKVRDEIEQLMDDDGDMAEMYLTEKNTRLDTLSYGGDQSISGYRLSDGPHTVSAPVSPVSYRRKLGLEFFKTNEVVYDLHSLRSGVTTRNPEKLATFPADAFVEVAEARDSCTRPSVHRTQQEQIQACYQPQPTPPKMP